MKIGKGKNQREREKEKYEREKERVERKMVRNRMRKDSVKRSERIEEYSFEVYLSFGENEGGKERK